MQEQTNAFILNVFYINLDKQQQQLLITKIILNSARQPLYRNARENWEDMNWKEYKMTYDWKQQYYACDQSNHIISNYEAFIMLINTEKIH